MQVVSQHSNCYLADRVDLWTGTNNDPETKNTYQEVPDLQNGISEKCEFAQKELSKVRERNHKLFNTKTKWRRFKPQDRAWVLNARCQSRFDLNWIGHATEVT